MPSYVHRAVILDLQYMHVSNTFPDSTKHFVASIMQQNRNNSNKKNEHVQ